MVVVVVAGSLLTLVEARLDEVSASAVTERVDDSDAFLHDSAFCVHEKDIAVNIIHFIFSCYVNLVSSE